MSCVREFVISVNLRAFRMDSAAQEQVRFFEENEDLEIAEKSLVAAAVANGARTAYADSDGGRWIRELPAGNSQLNVSTCSNNACRRPGGEAARISNRIACDEKREPVLLVTETVPLAIARNGHNMVMEPTVRKGAVAEAIQAGNFEFTGSSAVPDPQRRKVRLVAENKRYADEETVIVFLRVWLTHVMSPPPLLNRRSHRLCFGADCPT